MTWVGFPKEQVTVLSGDDSLHRYRTDTGATRSFCDRCGSTLFYEGPRWPGEVHVTRANIKGKIDREPSHHVFVDDRASWWTITDGLPQHGGASDEDPA